MGSYFVLCATAALIASVAMACSALCIAWTVPAWRQRLAKPRNASNLQPTDAQSLTGWPAQLGSVLISIGIAGSAILAWYGFFAILAHM